jgi:selenide,water dikinase
MSPPRLLLIGPGHANLLVLEALARRRLPQAEVVLVSPETTQVYSGMVPGFIEGRYQSDEIAIDLGRLARAAACRLVAGRVARIDSRASTATLEDGTVVPYDVASVAVGGAPPGSGIKGAMVHALSAKPIDRAIALVEALDRLAAEPRPEPRRLIVIGAGAGAVEAELALCARARLDRQGASDVIISILDARSELFGGRLPAWSDLLARVLAEHDVTLRLGVGAAEVGPDFVRLSDGRVQPADLVLCAAAPHAPALFRAAELPVDAHGFLLVDDTLRVQDCPGLFGAGDGVTLASAPRNPWAGGVAVRTGEVLVRNLASALAGRGGYRHYQPSDRHLALLNAGDGRALLFYGPVALVSRWAMRLKDHIDRRFMTRFPRPPGGTAAGGGS